MAIDNALEPIREFMLRQVRSKDLKLFVDLADIDDISNYSEIPTSALIPAFIISELKTGFEVWFFNFYTFYRYRYDCCQYLDGSGDDDASARYDIYAILKILLFIMVDGWNLIVEKNNTVDTLMEVQCGSRHGSGYFYISPKDNSITSGPNATVCIDGRADSGSLSGDNANTEQTLAFVPKILAVFLVLMAAGPWLLQNLMSMTMTIFGYIDKIILK